MLKAQLAVHLALCTSNSTIAMRICLEPFPSLMGHNQGTSTGQVTSLGWTQANSEDTDMNEIWSAASKELTSQKGPKLTHNAGGLVLTVHFSASFKCSKHGFASFLVAQGHYSKYQRLQ